MNNFLMIMYVILSEAKNLYAQKRKLSIHTAEILRHCVPQNDAAGSYVFMNDYGA
jgi:hypothetical protein